MKVIYNKVIPINGYKCVNLFGVLFVREDEVDDTVKQLIATWERS